MVWYCRPSIIPSPSPSPIHGPTAMKTIPTTILCCMASSLLFGPINAFTTVDPSRLASTPHQLAASIAVDGSRRCRQSSSHGSIVATRTASSLRLDVTSSTPDLSIVALVAGQENYGLGIVSLIEALWSFVQSPSMSHAKVLLPACIACIVLFVISGPMITSGDASSVTLGLEISTVVSIMLGARYDTSGGGGGTFFSFFVTFIVLVMPPLFHPVNGDDHDIRSACDGGERENDS